MGQRKQARILSTKLLLSLTTVALLTVTITAIYGLTERHTRQALRRELELRLLLEARHLALLSTDALLGDFPELTLCPIITEMLNTRSDLATAAVVDHAGIVQGHADVRRLGNPLSELHDFEPYTPRVPLAEGEQLLASENLLAAHVPARHAGGQLVGAVVVAKNRNELDAVLSASRREVAILAAGLSLLGVVLAVLLVQRLMAPVDVIRAGLERIGEGDLDTPIAVKSRTELGLLASTINTMATQLKRSQALARAREREVIATQSEVIHTLGEVVENRSQETGGHIDRVAEGAALLAELAGLPPEKRELLRMAAPMHDVGKIGIPDSILHKPGKLTDDEFETMKRHTVIGAKILSESDRPIFRVAAIIAAQHHERWDGRGYPAGLAGEAIHPYGRIVSIVDVFDALTSDRCYRPAMPLGKVLAIMEEGRGTQFDPRLLDLFLAHLGRFVELKQDIDSTQTPPAESSLEPTTSPEPVGTPG
jgi:HD-GYP domain-containing protein (c-di-GMP phosphodiesterase class II)